MIKALNRIFKQDKERMTIPKSVQQVIPAKHIWEDGIWFVGNKYSKCWRFTDINYDIASKDDKEAMFFAYSDILNALDPDATTKISIFNRQLNKQELEKSILLPLKNDQYDGYRKEYNDMLMSKVTDATNSIVQERYITVSVAARDIDEARSYFIRVSSDFTSRFAQLSSVCDELDSVERLRIFHDFYRPGEESVYTVDLKRMMREGRSFRDYIAPDSFEFKKDYFVMGEQFGRVLFMKDYNNAAASKLRHVMHRLQKTLSEAGVEHILKYSPHARTFNCESVQCDYFDFLSEKEEVIKKYKGKYMSQYSWAEGRINTLNRIKIKHFPNAAEELYED